MSAKIGELEDLPLIGCTEHNHFLTKHVCHFYLITRSHFISKRYNEINDAQRKKTRRNRKNAKLCYIIVSFQCLYIDFLYDSNTGADIISCFNLLFHTVISSFNFSFRTVISLYF